MKSYTICSSYDWKELEKEVAKHIQSGYVPCGGLAIISAPTSATWNVLYMQAMVLKSAIK